jgi:SPP1 gp7 family putative phage head morphogenesis protein
MNVLQTRKHIKKLYDNIERMIVKEFANAAMQIEQSVYDEALEMGFDGDIRDLDESFVEEFFEEYNPVTKYVFSNELGRKESRLFESLIASELDRHHSYATAEKLLIRQVRQYAINLEDKVAKVVYKDIGVEKVRWVAEKDERTCGTCHDLDGMVFDLADAPDKQHYACRCYLIPVKG